MLGAWLAVARFAGRALLLTLLNTLLALPSVVVGLVIYLLLSRSGPLGFLGWLFSFKAMVLAQTVLVLPVVTALTRQAIEDADRAHGEQLRSLGAGTLARALLLVWDERYALFTVLIAAFGRAVSEVGAVMIVGGNIDGFTRVMTTAIALETSKGDLPLALALGLVLLGVVLLLNSRIAAMRGWRERVDGGAVDAAAGAACEERHRERHSAGLQLRAIDVRYGSMSGAASTPRCRSVRANAWRWSAPTAAARARCCACCTALSRTPTARSSARAARRARPCCSSGRTCCAPACATTSRWRCGCTARRGATAQAEAMRGARRASAWRRSPSATRAPCRAGSSSAWRWRAPGRCIPRCCCSTSPPRASTRPPSARSRR